jgi:phosphate/sulfate permease
LGGRIKWSSKLLLSRIAIAWLVTLPVTITIAALLYYLFDSPSLSFG